MNGSHELPDNENQRLRDLLNNNTDWVWEVDAQGRYTYVSEVVTQLLGYPAEQVLGKTPFDFMPPAEAQRVGEAFGAIVGAKRAFSGLINRNIHAKGHIVVLETSGVPLLNAQGELLGYRGIDRDISSLGERMLQIEAVHENAPVALCTLDRQGRIVMANRSMARLLNLAQDQLIGASLVELMPAVRVMLQTDLANADAGGTMREHEVAWQNWWLHATPHPLRDANGQIAGLSIAWMDITARKQAEHHLTEANRLLAQHARQDYLTGLYNRRYLDEQLVMEVARARRDAQPLSVCMVDVDYFKLYNDNLGHQAGDGCLRELAKVLLRSAGQPTDTVSRYGGEEFATILPASNAARARAVAEQMREQVHLLNLPHPALARGRVSISVGVVTREPQSWSHAAGQPSEQNEQIASALIRHADNALYAAKHQGRDRVIHLQVTGNGPDEAALLEKP